MSSNWPYPGNIFRLYTDTMRLETVVLWRLLEAVPTTM